MLMLCRQRQFSFQTWQRWREAIIEYNKALKVNPKYANAFFNKGISLHNLGGYAEAIAKSDKVLKIDPNYANAYNNKGFSLSKLGRYAEAIAESR